MKNTKYMYNVPRRGEPKPFHPCITFYFTIICWWMGCCRRHTINGEKIIFYNDLLQQLHKEIVKWVKLGQGGSEAPGVSAILTSPQRRSEWSECSEALIAAT